jgi:branched-subunit amino acid aminotransferase/4-amino-4-deoxychorismate lyase
MSTPLVFANGRLLPHTEAHIALNDAGFVFGATVTDLCRTFRHRLFRLEDHLARFRRSCLLAQVPQSVADEELARVAEELVAHNAALLRSDEDLALVMLATPGPIGYYAGQAGGPGDGIPTLLLHTFPLPFVRYRSLFTDGARLIVPGTRHVPATCVDPRIKHRSRMHWWLADREARQQEAGASALLLDGDGYVTETAAANFLVVKEGVVRTPPRTAVLGGISLQTVEDLCADLGIPFQEQQLPLNDCLTADEAMLSSTPYCVAGVRSINGQPLTWPGPIFERLLAAWSQRVGLDIRGQIFSHP